MPNVAGTYRHYISSYSYGLWCQKLYAPISLRIVNHNELLLLLLAHTFINVQRYTLTSVWSNTDVQEDDWIPNRFHVLDVVIVHNLFTFYHLLKLVFFTYSSTNH
jgi:hypothetical protein